MNNALSKIVMQLISEVEAKVADPAARKEAKAELDGFLSTCERLKALGVKFEAEAESVVGKIEGAVKNAADSVVDHVEGLLS